MPQIELRYGRTYIPFDYDQDRFEAFGTAGNADKIVPLPLSVMASRY